VLFATVSGRFGLFQPIHPFPREGTVRKQNIFSATGGHSARPSWLVLFLAAVAVSCLVCGLLLLWLHATREPQSYRAPTAIVLIALAAVQTRFMLKLWQRGTFDQIDPARRRLFFKSLFAGGVLSYIASLLLGPDPSVAYLFAAALGTWHTATLWLIVVPPVQVADWLSRARGGIVERFGQGLVVGLSLSVAAEGILRLYALLADDPLPATYVASTLTLPPGESIGGQLVNAQGYWDDEFKYQPRPGVFRIAVLGDGVTLSGSAQTNLLVRLEQSVPGIEVYNFSLPSAGPREYAAQLMHKVAEYQPELVLTFFSIGDDVTEEVPLPGMFDWRNLRLYQWSARGVLPRGESNASIPLMPAAAASREEFLAAMAAQLDVCRTPISGELGHRWREATGYLGDIDEFCRQREIAQALVIVPSELQVDGQLCETLRRRAGVSAKGVDIELPQRRLADFAQERQLPVVDLLPPLRAAAGTLYLRNQKHWNDRGHAVAADALGRWIEHRYASQLGATTHAALR
jgi:hypothetical protein